MVNNIYINEHSSIKIIDKKVIYFDPFRIKENKHDADLIFITHSHFDHYSKEDIEKILNKNTILISPLSMKNEVNAIYENIVYFDVDEEKNIEGYKVKAVPSYNVNKPMHPKENKWLGYIIEINNQQIYVCGDTDYNEGNEKIRCDIILIPVGGTYTMNAMEAANLVNKIEPKIAIPTHYGTLVGEKNHGDEFEKYVNKNIKVVKKLQF